MRFTNRVGIAYYVSFTAVLCLWLCGSNGAESSFKIFRGEQDIFMNMKCYPESERCTDDQCNSYGAECMDAKCKFCRCMKGRSTFMINQDSGVCKSDKKIVPESVPDEAFWLKNKESEKCLKLVEDDSRTYVIGTNCTASPSLDLLWIRANTRNKQLMNVKTLKCMRRRREDGDNVTISACKKTSASWQRIQCISLDPVGIFKIRWNVWKNKTKQPPRFLHLQDSNAYAIALKSGNQQWSSAKTPCNITDYKGCYRFCDGSFMKYLDYNKTNVPLYISAPIFEQNDGKCDVWEKFKFIRDSQEWKDGNGRLFSITDKTKELKIISMENLRCWNGSLLKLTVFCRNNDTNETSCVLLKLKSLPPYEIFPTSVPTEYQKMSSKPPSQSLTPITSTTENPQEGFKEEASESNGTRSAAIAVTVTLLLVALALALGYLVYYRRRKRAQVPQKNDLGVINYSKEIHEDPDRIYETIKDNGNNEVPPNQLGTSSDTYSYPDSNIVSIPASTEQEYTYANDTDSPRSSVGAKPAAKGPVRNGAVYETLEQPGQMTDDDFYNYPNNTKIANQGSSELEYIYAKDTDLPTANTKAVRERKSEPATSGGLYHTLEQEGPASTEQEYSYAKNTDMPLIPLSIVQTSNEHSSPAPNSALYHTLEEPNPPQAPVYSTLEEPEDVENPQIPTAQIPEMLTTPVAYHRIDGMLYSIFITKSVSLSNMYKKFHLYYSTY